MKDEDFNTSPAHADFSKKLRGGMSILLEFDNVILFTLWMFFGYLRFQRSNILFSIYDIKFLFNKKNFKNLSI